MTIKIQTGNLNQITGENGVTYRGTPAELIAWADALEKNASRRGWSGVVDRDTARQLREAASK